MLAGGFRGVAHLYVGEEAIAVGVCHALRQDDYIASTHRGHGHLIAKGGDLGRMLAEITHKATGYCKGYGGSLHITDVSLGILGMNGIVGASHLFAAGAAYGIKVKGTDQVAVSFGGDGSIQGNFFSSAANAAAAWKLPWIGVIENNGYQIWVRASDVYGIVDLARRADGYGIEGRVVDGNDVLAVYNVAKYAVDKARAGGGPTIIECKTYRWYDHYGAGGAKIGVDGAFGLGYRSDRELRDWMAKDPIPRFREFLVSRAGPHRRSRPTRSSSEVRHSGGRTPPVRRAAAGARNPRTDCGTCLPRARFRCTPVDRRRTSHAQEHELRDSGGHPGRDAAGQAADAALRVPAAGALEPRWTEFGRWRVRFCAIDEQWIVGAVAGHVDDRRAGHRPHPQHDHVHSLRADVQPCRQAAAHDRRPGGLPDGAVGRHGGPDPVQGGQHADAGWSRPTPGWPG